MELRLRAELSSLVADLEDRDDLVLDLDLDLVLASSVLFLKLVEVEATWSLVIDSEVDGTNRGRKARA